MPKKASKKRKIPAETETLDAGDASQTRQKTNPPPEIHEEHNRLNDRHQDDEMQDYEPGGPELTHNSDNTAIEYEYGDLEECLIQSFEARMAHAKISSDLITSFCKRLDP